jgi:hypothetical protein
MATENREYGDCWCVFELIFHSYAGENEETHLSGQPGDILNESGTLPVCTSLQFSVQPSLYSFRTFVYCVVWDKKLCPFLECKSTQFPILQTLFVLLQKGGRKEGDVWGT